MSDETLKAKKCLSSTSWWSIFLFGLLLAILSSSSTTRALTEDERIEEYYRRGYKWPPTDRIQPNDPGWKSRMLHRLRQVEEVEDDTERWEGFAQTLSAAMIQPNFTEHGFALARAPEELTAALRKGIRDGVAAGPRLEEKLSAIDGPTPWFVENKHLRSRVSLHFFCFFCGTATTCFFFFHFSFLFDVPNSLYIRFAYESNDRPNDRIKQNKIYDDRS